MVRVYQRRTLACSGLLLEWSGSIRAGRWPGELLCQTGLDSPPAPLRTAPWYLRSDHRTRSFFFPLEHKVVHSKYTKHKWGLLCPQDQILHCIKRKGYLHASSLVLYKCVSYYLSSPPPPTPSQLLFQNACLCTHFQVFWVRVSTSVTCLSWLTLSESHHNPFCSLFCASSQLNKHSWLTRSLPAVVLIDWLIDRFYIAIDRFYIALFSALEQTHCACMWFYMSE